jgi:hypothetical protein
MFLDNADDSDKSEPLLKYIPRISKGRLVLTSRDIRLASSLCDVILVQPPPVQEAREMLQSVIGGAELEEPDSSKLVLALQRVPLAITQASAFIKKNHITVRQYYELFTASKFNAEELLGEGFTDLSRGLDSTNSVSATWAISFEVIRRQNPQAAELLSLISLLDEDQIPDYILRQEDQSTAQFDEAIGLLLNFSMISAHNDRETFDIHPLVRKSARRWLELERSLSQWEVEALRRLSANFPNGEYETWEKCAELLPHADVVLSYHVGCVKRWRHLHKLACVSALALQII